MESGNTKITTGQFQPCDGDVRQGNCKKQFLEKLKELDGPKATRHELIHLAVKPPKHISVKTFIRLFEASVEEVTFEGMVDVSSHAGAQILGEGNCGSYRPATLTSLLPETFERVLRDMTVNHMKTKKLMTANYHWLPRGRGRYNGQRQSSRCFMTGIPEGLHFREPQLP